MNINIETTPERLRTLNDDELVMHLHLAVRGERRFTIQILHHLNEMQRRRLHLDLGYSSLHDYCVRCLKDSSSKAGRRIQAARCIRRFPEVLDLLQVRALSLSTISLIEPILTDENKESVLSRARNASHRDVQKVVSEYRTPVAFRDRTIPVRVAAHHAPNVDEVLFDRELAQNAEHYTPPLTPVYEQKMLVQFLADDELIMIFEEVKNLHGARMSFAEILKVVFVEYRERHHPVSRHARRQARKGAASLDSQRRECGTQPSRLSQGTKRPDTPDSQRRECPTEGSRHISDEVRDEVFLRDRGRCTFVSRDGTHCGSMRDLQMDHIHPFATAGGNDPENLRLLCAAHNRRAAETAFGPMQELYRRE